MLPTGISAGRARRPPAGRRGIALLLVTVLIAVLAVFSLMAVSYGVASMTSDLDAAGETRAAYLAELGRADAFAYVQNHPAASWPVTRELTTVNDATGAPSGQYSYTISDLTLPEGNQRRRGDVEAYWPDSTRPVAQASLSFWMEQEDAVWYLRGWTLTTEAVSR
jgi:hypothetical protein